jgi:hypothetical protein
VSDRRTIHIHYNGLDRLILECVHPVLERVAGGLERGYWERHYAGGPHLRVSLVGGQGLDAAAAELAAAAERFVAEHPSADLERYSPEQAAEMMKREGAQWDADDLVYRNNVVRIVPHRAHAYVSGEAELMAEEFRHDVGPLVVRILSGPRPRAEQLLRLYFLNALLVCDGKIPEGSVSYKSHWEGFAAWIRDARVPERIGRAFDASAGGVIALMLEVEELHRRGALDEDPLLGDWSRLMERYAARTHEVLRAGKQVTPQPGTVQEAREARDSLMGVLSRDSEFVRVVWDDPRFIASVQFEPGFLVPRVLVNLLYLAVAAAGLTMLDRMTLCHHAFRAAEVHFGRDLTDILRGNVERVVARSGHRAPAHAAPQGL